MPSMDYDVLIIGAGPGGIFTAYELTKGLEKPPRVAVFEKGLPLKERICPMDGENNTQCKKCKICSVTSGFGGAGAFSDGKYNISFSGNFHDRIGKERAIGLMRYVDEVLLQSGAGETRLYSTMSGEIREKCNECGLEPLDADVRHLGTDNNYVVLGNLYSELEGKADFFFRSAVKSVERAGDGYRVRLENGRSVTGAQCVISAGRSGSKWMQEVCHTLGIPTVSNRVDIGVRLEVPAEVYRHLTDELYEPKLVYHTEKSGDTVRIFCMNPHGVVICENTNGILTANGHSYEDPERQTDNTNFALLVSTQITKPFRNSNEYLESVARLANLMGGVVVQRFGDLIRRQGSTSQEIAACKVRPTLSATPGDLGLVLPGRILDDLIEMIYALDRLAPGTADDDTLLYGVEVKYYNMEVEVDSRLETRCPGLFVIGDCGGLTHNLTNACAAGVYVARTIRQRGMTGRMDAI